MGWLVTSRSMHFAMLFEHGEAHTGRTNAARRRAALLRDAYPEG